MYDDALPEILASVTNTLLTEDNQAWLRASLPVKLGGLGIRRAIQVAPSAYLPSVASSTDLVAVISPAYHQSLPAPSINVVLAQWSENHTLDPP